MQYAKNDAKSEIPKLIPITIKEKYVWKFSSFSIKNKGNAKTAVSAAKIGMFIIFLLLLAADAPKTAERTINSIAINKPYFKKKTK